MYFPCKERQSSIESGQFQLVRIYLGRFSLWGQQIDGDMTTSLRQQNYLLWARKTKGCSGNRASNPPRPSRESGRYTRHAMGPAIHLKFKNACHDVLNRTISFPPCNYSVFCSYHYVMQVQKNEPPMLVSPFCSPGRFLFRVDSCVSIRVGRPQFHPGLTEEPT